MKTKHTKSQGRLNQLDIPVGIRAMVYDRDGELCRICGSYQSMSIHHIVSRNKGRNHDICNLVLLCGECHERAQLGKLPMWLANSEKQLFHITPVKAYMHTYNFNDIICQSHNQSISLEKNMVPIEAYVCPESKAVL